MSGEYCKLLSLPTSLGNAGIATLDSMVFMQGKCATKRLTFGNDICTNYTGCLLYVKNMSDQIEVNYSYVRSTRRIMNYLMLKIWSWAPLLGWDWAGLWEGGWRDNGN